MPQVSLEATIDGRGWIVRCDRCGVVEAYPRVRSEAVTRVVEHRLEHGPSSTSRPANL